MTIGAESEIPAVETDIWVGRPSQLVNLIPFLFSVVMFFVLAIGVMTAWSAYDLTPYPYAKDIAIAIVCLPIIYAVYKWLSVHFEIKVVTTKRVKIRKSIWNSGMRPVQLFRIKDHDYDEPWFWKPFGLGSVTLDTSDHSDPRVRFRAIKRARELHDQIECLVVSERRNQGVQEIDYKM